MIILLDIRNAAPISEASVVDTKWKPRHHVVIVEMRNSAKFVYYTPFSDGRGHFIILSTSVYLYISVYLDFLSIRAICPSQIFISFCNRNDVIINFET
jgi:hypothetical protein